MTKLLLVFIIYVVLENDQFANVDGGGIGMRVVLRDEGDDIDVGGAGDVDRLCRRKAEDQELHRDGFIARRRTRASFTL